VTYPTLGGLLLALLLLPVPPAGAISIDQPPAPIVINTNDNGDGSLRQALLKAQEGDTITFDIPTSDPGYHKGAWTISLTSGELAFNKNVTISGPGPNYLVLKRNERAAIFNIFPVNRPHLVTIEGITVGDPPAPPDPFVLLTAGTTAMVFLSVALVYRHLWRRNGRRMRFGLLWNGYRKPICARCDNLLHVLNDYSFQCPSCEVELGAQGENGRTISPREALSKIRLKEYWSQN
jgi:hypothetical protein